ncbi:golgin subfamily A member 6-like protein 26 [Palaemon carinicauda]|uniref:golgin subfamily A member 6-like protein 26 n=1 Tax=Palaemon carinicauda TaxID=392227 RepID=UPI0035B6811B
MTSSLLIGGKLSLFGPSTYIEVLARIVVSMLGTLVFILYSEKNCFLPLDKPEEETWFWNSYVTDRLGHASKDKIEEENAPLRENRNTNAKPQEVFKYFLSNAQVQGCDLSLAKYLIQTLEGMVRELDQEIIKAKDKKKKLNNMRKRLENEINAKTNDELVLFSKQYPLIQKKRKKIKSSQQVIRKYEGLRPAGIKQFPGSPEEHECQPEGSAGLSEDQEWQPTHHEWLTKQKWRQETPPAIQIKPPRTQGKSPTVQGWQTGAKEIPPAYKDGRREHKEWLRQYKDGRREHKECLRQYEDGRREHKEWLRQYEDGRREHKEWLRQYEHGRREHKEWLRQYKDGRREHKEWLRQYEDGRREHKEWLRQYKHGRREHKEWLRQYKHGRQEHKEWLRQYKHGRREHKEWLRQYKHGRREHKEWLRQYKHGRREHKE